MASLMKKTEQYQALPAKVSQQVLRGLDWNSLKRPLKAGGVASMAANRPLLDGGASVAAGGPAANRWRETASTI